MATETVDQLAEAIEVRLPLGEGGRRMSVDIAAEQRGRLYGLGNGECSAVANAIRCDRGMVQL